MFFGLWYDWTILIMIPAVLFALYAQSKVNSSFDKYSSVLSSRGITGSDAARMILDANGLSEVRVERVSGRLTDHYDPKDNVIRLSDSVYDDCSCAAIGVAAHECGHAVQYAKNYAPIKIRAAIVPITNFGSRFSMIFIMIGLALSAFSQSASFETGINIALIGVALYSLVAVFQLITLPVEFNASSRALNTLKGYNILSDDELYGAKQVLSAAALTYVAALASTIATILRLLIIIMGRSNNRRR